MLTFWSGGWVLLLAGVLVIGVVAWGVLGRWNAVPEIGDGRHIDTYGFDLTTCLVPRQTLAAAGFPRDGVPAITVGEYLTPEEAEALNHELVRDHLGKYLVSGDRVVGVHIAEETRAYPLRVLNWHEIVNDTVGGRPIAVTYSPLCDSAVVFERQVGGETLEFGVSGLLCNSNLVMYDRRSAGGDESLWSQLQFRAIAGPAAAAGCRLELLPCAVMSWGAWRTLHPSTRVLAPDRERLKLYKRTYDRYLASDEIRFPVDPLPPTNLLPWKSSVLAVRAGDEWIAFWEDRLRRQLQAGGGTVRIAGCDVAFHLDDASGDVWLEDRSGSTPPLISIRALWFAWYAQHPDSRVEP